MDGSKRKSKESVESLKRRSEQKEVEKKFIEAEKALSEAEELKIVYRNKQH